jgi:hypothetical protein
VLAEKHSSTAAGLNTVDVRVPPIDPEPERLRRKRSSHSKIEGLASANISAARKVLKFRRRHLSKGQQAMAVATLYPEAEKRGRGKKDSSQIEEFSSANISSARTVLKWLPTNAAPFLAGSKPSKSRAGA